MNRPVKLIAGVPHRQVRCLKCQELIWMPVAPGNRDDGIVCGTCLTEPGPAGDAGGGRRVIRKAENQS